MRSSELYRPTCFCMIKHRVETVTVNDVNVNDEDEEPSLDEGRPKSERLLLIYATKFI